MQLFRNVDSGEYPLDVVGRSFTVELIILEGITIVVVIVVVVVTTNVGILNMTIVLIAAMDSTINRMMKIVAVVVVA